MKIIRHKTEKKDDCVIIDIDKWVECPFVIVKSFLKICQIVVVKAYLDIMCPTCDSTLKSQYFGDMGGCLYCGDTKSNNSRQNTIVINTNPPSVTSTNSVVIIRNSNSRMCIINSDDCCMTVCVFLIIVLVIGTLYLFGNCAYLLGRLVIHQIHGEDHSHKSDLSIQNAVWGILGWSLIAFVLYILLYIEHRYERSRRSRN